VIVLICDSALNFCATLPAVTTDGRPLRRDAQRNLERIRSAAITVFREQGLGASHEAIAREADVSIGTVYRRFPDREELIDALFESELDAVVVAATGAAELDDPWESVTALFTRTMELAAGNVGLGQILAGSPHGAERVQRVRERLAPIATAVIERARTAGAIRPDAAPLDVPMIHVMIHALIEAGREHAPDVWRRYLALILDGLRAEARPRAPLPGELSLDAVDAVITASHVPRR
jgi:AcrR family transcriptional regulator